MKEIGGYFGLEQLVSNEFYKNLIPLNSGRNALLYLIRAKSIRKLYIPYYLCSSISNMLKMYDCNFEYYNIDSHFMPIFNKTLAEGEYLFVVNFYGQLIHDEIIGLKKKHNSIIIDNTQAFFQKPVNGIDTIYSCRKFFGVADGAYLYTDYKIEYDLELDISKSRMTHILGRYEGIASEYYNDFCNNDQCFKNEQLKYMSKLTHNILGAINYESVRETRNSNYQHLQRKLNRFNKLKLITPDGAFSYPFYIKNGIEVRTKLAKRKIYIPVFWPSVLHDTPDESIEHDYAENVLPLPCDQRYCLDDMQYMVDEINSFI